MRDPEYQAWRVQQNRQQQAQYRAAQQRRSPVQQARTYSSSGRRSGGSSAPAPAAASSAGLGNTDAAVAEENSIFPFLGTNGQSPWQQDANTFLAEELGAGAARGGSDPFTGWNGGGTGGILGTGIGKANPFQGFGFPKNASPSDYFALATVAESFASYAGHKYMPTPVMLQYAVDRGMAQWDTRALYQWMAGLSGIQNSMPWVANGMSQTDWNTKSRALDEIALDMTGQNTWGAAGLDPGLQQQAIANGWSSAEVKNHLMQDPNAMNKYGWIKYGKTYQSFQEYKASNAAELQSRYGKNVTDQQAIENLAKPLQSVQGGGTAFQYESQQSGAKDMTGHQSEVR